MLSLWGLMQLTIKKKTQSLTLETGRCKARRPLKWTTSHAWRFSWWMLAIARWSRRRLRCLTHIKSRHCMKILKRRWLMLRQETVVSFTTSPAIQLFFLIQLRSKEIKPWVVSRRTRLSFRRKSRGMRYNQIRATQDSIRAKSLHQLKVHKAQAWQVMSLLSIQLIWKTKIHICSGQLSWIILQL